MDRFVKTFDAIEDDDLRLCLSNGVAYQADMHATAAYNDSYHDHYASLENTPIARHLNFGRRSLLARHAKAGASVLDIGAGCGTFVRTAREWGFAARGFDVIPKTAALLKSADAYAEIGGGFDVVTFWDSLEHIEDPGAVLNSIGNATVLVAIPVFEDLRNIRRSKHYKPGEHLYYWQPQGFIDWMALYGFRLLETSSHETDAGRESIAAFAFRHEFESIEAAA